MKTTALHQLNRLYLAIGTWKGVANWTGFNRATINKWFSGKKGMSRNSEACIRLSTRIWFATHE